VSDLQARNADAMLQALEHLRSEHQSQHGELDVLRRRVAQLEGQLAAVQAQVGALLARTIGSGSTAR